MTDKADILSKLSSSLRAAEQAVDDDAWYLAMHELRALAWEGKELIHAKRLPSKAAKQLTSKANDLEALGLYVFKELK